MLLFAFVGKGKTMKQSDNEKIRKIRNRCRNVLQRVKKYFRLHMFPVVLSVAIIGGVVFGSYYRVYATGVEELFYYTYFDLMSGLFAETGMEFALKDDYYTKSDRVSGKQVWDNFCTWVEEKAKTLALPVEVVNKTVFDELKDLPNKVTSAGASMSEKLSELLAKVLPTFNDTNGNQFDCSSVESVNNYVAALTGGGVLDDMRAKLVVNDGYLLNIVYDEGVYKVFVERRDYLVDDYRFYNGFTDFKSLMVFQGKEYSEFLTAYGSIVKDGHTDADMSCYTCSLNYQWIVKNGALTVSNGTSLNDYAKVKTVDDNTVYVPGVGYKTNWDILKDILNDRVTTDAEEEAWNSRYNFDNDNKDDREKKKKDNEKDKLPVAIPIILPNKKPDSSEKDSEKDSEKGTEDVVPGGNPDQSKNPMINPDTGHYIDPDTGYDIDPDTGKLIDPNTGELIDPNIPSVADRAGNWKRLFPFCIPWDMMELVKTLKADKKAPRFTFKYTFEKINYTWVVDVNMADYWKYIKIFRWGMTIFFIIGLFFLTSKITTFVHRMSG